MKSKAPLLFAELLIMTLVFSLSAAWCLQVFAVSAKMKDDTVIRDNAVLAACNMAEIIVSCGGDYDAAADISGGIWDGEVIRVYYDGHWNTVSDSDAFSLSVIPAEGSSEYLGRAQITVSDESGNILYTLPTSWQREAVS